MGILKALGLGLGIVVLKFLVPEVFAAITGALIAFFELATTVFATMHAAVGAVPFQPEYP
ncbi:MAG TPA: hypothetical protein VLB83_01475 [Candidatus Paceibacterota bacterium]|nr:hypothetical protein [Candidatus Paceibacterota bacterium]